MFLRWMFLISVKREQWLISALQDKCHLTERTLVLVQEGLYLAKSSIIGFSKQLRWQRKILVVAGTEAVAEVSFRPSVICCNSQNNTYAHRVKPVTRSFYMQEKMSCPEIQSSDYWNIFRSLNCSFYLWIFKEYF